MFCGSVRQYLASEKQGEGKKEGKEPNWDKVEGGGGRWEGRGRAVSGNARRLQEFSTQPLFTPGQ